MVILQINRVIPRVLICRFGREERHRPAKAWLGESPGRIVTSNRRHLARQYKRVVQQFRNLLVWDHGPLSPPLNKLGSHRGRLERSCKPSRMPREFKSHTQLHYLLADKRKRTGYVNAFIGRFVENKAGNIYTYGALVQLVKYTALVLL